MSTKSKGSKAERELIHLFWNTNQWAAFRAAGSGSMQFPCPDIIAGNNIRRFAIECKATKSKKQYLEREQIENLKKFCNLFGAEPWIAVRFDKKVKTSTNWYFLSLDDLKETEGNNFVITAESAMARGLLFEELIR